MDNRFKQLRLEYNNHVSADKDELSQTDLANEMGLVRSHISKLESGKTNPTLEDYIYYHDKFGVTIEYLLGETNSKKPKNMRVGRDLGVTDAVADTMTDIRKASSKEYDYSAVLNAFIGNGENTFSFISEIFACLLSEHVNGRTATNDALMISNILNYLEKYVKPQLTEALERRRQYEEQLDDLPPEVRYDIPKTTEG